MPKDAIYVLENLLLRCGNAVSVNLDEDVTRVGNQFSKEMHKNNFFFFLKFCKFLKMDVKLFGIRYRVPLQVS